MFYNAVTNIYVFIFPMKRSILKLTFQIYDFLKEYCLNVIKFLPTKILKIISK